MLNYRVPGVYREDVFPPPPPVLLTGVPVFLGYARQGPLNEPVRLSLWPQFEAAFGASFPGGYLAYAVRGFFENSGLICYVVRLDDALDGMTGLQKGLTAVTELEDNDLLCAPDVVRPSSQTLETMAMMQQTILDHCRQLGDRFAILDAPFTADTEIILAHRQRLNGTYGALYHPWVWVPGIQANPLYVPPSGHLAGIYARTDQQIGVYKAPANELLEGVLDLYVNPAINELERLYTADVNCLRALPGRGLRVWGTRTLGDAPEWQYIPTRRLFLTMSRWLERFMTELPYEPNNIRLWVRVIREVTVYLDGLFQQGAFKGVTAEQAYYVKCDGETNPLAVREAGMVVTEIGVAPAVPGEFIVARIIHGASGVNITAVSQ